MEVSGVLQSKAELRQSAAQVTVAGGNHPPHAEATAALVCFWRSPPRSFSIHLPVPALGFLSERLAIRTLIVTAVKRGSS